MKVLASIVSTIFQPLFLPIYAFMLYLLIEDESTAFLRDSGAEVLVNRYLILITLLTAVIPIISMMVMKKSGIITSLQLPIRRERIPVMMLVLMYYLFTFYLFKTGDNMWNHIFGLFMAFLTGGLILSVISLLITLKWKISLHAIGISGMAGAFLGMTEVMYPINNFEEMRIINAALLFFVGVVCASRLILKVHSINQVLAGLILGGTVEYLIVSNSFSF